MVQPPFLHLHPASGVASFGRRGGVHPSLPGLQPRRGCKIRILCGCIAFGGGRFPWVTLTLTHG